MPRLEALLVAHLEVLFTTVLLSHLLVRHDTAEFRVVGVLLLQVDDPQWSRLETDRVLLLFLLPLEVVLSRLAVLPEDRVLKELFTVLEVVAVVFGPLEALKVLELVRVSGFSSAEATVLHLLLSLVLGNLPLLVLRLVLIRLAVVVTAEEAGSKLDPASL